jgi:APA family basic amino acid/polyamine antiporter
MVSYIGLESISEAAEETRHPHRVIPKSTMWLIVAVLMVTVCAATLCVGMRENITENGVYPAFSPFDIGTRFQNNPIAGLAAGIGTFTHSTMVLIALTIWVGFLAFTMVTISANTGVIGASRVTYSMGRFKMMPEWFKKVHSKFRVPHRTIIIFSGAAIGFILLAVGVSALFPFLEEPTIMLADLYSYGALVAFMLVNLALIKLRNKRPYLYRPWKQPFSIKFKKKGKNFDIPLLPLLGFTICFVVWILVLSFHLFGRIVGTLWFLIGVWCYLIFRFKRKLYLNEPAETLITSPRVAHMLHPDLSEKLRARYSKVMMREELKDIRG